VAGIYIHIPYCKHACSYCNFHFSTNQNNIEELVEAICKELYMQKTALKNVPIETIYIGGGTPSLLPLSLIDSLFNTIYKHFDTTSIKEVTLEANPDDITDEILSEWKNAHIDRLSIGVQSFFDEDLQFLSRVHNAKQSEKAIQASLAAGMEISLDLIYSIPTLTDKHWEMNLKKAISYNVPHLSCYSLTVEDKTKYAYDISKGVVKAPDDAKARIQFEKVIQMTAQFGYEHYEISNFAKPGKFALHNSSYWSGEPYLGVGPSAHSYFAEDDGLYIRQWNVSNNAKFINSINRGKIPFVNEILSPEERFNEYVMTGLRTKWGCDLNYIKKEFGDQLATDFVNNSESVISRKLIELDSEIYKLTLEGKLLSDKIISELMVV